MVLFQSFCYDVVFLNKTDIRNAYCKNVRQVRSKGYGLRKAQTTPTIATHKSPASSYEISQTLQQTLAKKRGIQVLVKEYAIWFENTSIELHPSPDEVA